MPNFVDVLPELRSFQLDNHESVEAVRSALSAMGSQPSGKRTYDLLSGPDLVARAIFNGRGRLRWLFVPSDLWPDARARIVADSQSQTNRVARTALLSYRELKGAFTVPGWLQIRPVGIPLNDRTAHGALSLSVPSGAFLPFAVEVRYRWSSLPFLEAHRRIAAVQHAQWLLSAFIDIPVFSITTSYSWAFIDYSYALVTCGVPHGLDDASDQTYTDVSHLPQLAPVPAAEYFAPLGISTSDFRVPDLIALHTRFRELPPPSALRFLRCCASIFAASSPAIGPPQKLVALVSAIEPLLEEGKRCSLCDSHTGIAESFRVFLDDYVKPSPEVRHIYEAVYALRSKIVHGGWNPDVDEPFFSLHSTDRSGGLAAWAAAKQGAVNWLMAQAP